MVRLSLLTEEAVRIKILNDYGTDGWELVAAVHERSEHIQFYFKRKIPIEVDV